MKFACPKCGQHLDADNDMAGASVSCPSCATALVVPVKRPSVGRGITAVISPAPQPPPLPDSSLDTRLTQTQSPPSSSNADSDRNPALPLWIPPEVKSVYKPSGKTGPWTWINLLGLGMAGLALSIVLAFPVGYAGCLTMHKFEGIAQNNIANGLALIGGLLFYFVFGPLLPSAGVILGVRRGCKRAQCRSPIRAQIAAALICGVLILCSWYLIPIYLAMLNGTAGMTANGINDIPWMLLICFYGVVVLAISTVGAGHEVKEMKFCEHCLDYMKERTLGHFSFDQTNVILSALQDGQTVQDAPKPLIVAPGAKPAANNYVTVKAYTCSCERSQLIEVIVNVLRKTEWGTVTHHVIDRCVFSGRVDDGVGRWLDGSK